MAGIPPIICAKHNNDNFFHFVTGFGCTRYNSVKKAGEDVGSELCIPLFEVPNEWVHNIIYPQGDQRPKFVLQSGLFDENAWTNYPFEPYKTSWNDDELFNGFS
ncbi:MAG: hypothetical protein VXX85_03630 [Candidatus Margulisiibacteriota bacterium]|nr:hypothetical protein [Candidatus Margulisiibacteriota bacterium]